jgi:hypothetical protein
MRLLTYTSKPADGSTPSQVTFSLARVESFSFRGSDRETQCEVTVKLISGSVHQFFAVPSKIEQLLLETAVV